MTELTTAQARAELTAFRMLLTMNGEIRPEVTEGGAARIIRTPRGKGHVAADASEQYPYDSNPLRNAPRFGGWVSACGRLMIGEIIGHGYYDSVDLRYFRNDEGLNPADELCAKCLRLAGLTMPGADS